MENSDSPSNDEPSLPQEAPQLTAIEMRVLGALMEKQLTTPDAYPLTLNSITSACNQKSSRDPISNYQTGELKRCLQGLEDKKLVHQEYGSRAEKYSQHFIKYLQLGKKQQALLCVMMLRGPQTVSELDTRTQRMCDFTDREDLEHGIARLCDRETPYAVRLSQQPGQRGERIAHLFSGMPSAATPNTPAYVESEVPTSVSQPAAEPNETVALLEMEVAELQKTVRSLQNETNDLRRQLETLYGLTGNVVTLAE